jgi:hypothetical protein
MSVPGFSMGWVPAPGYQAGQTHSRVSNLDNYQSFLHFVSG